MSTRAASSRRKASVSKPAGRSRGSAKLTTDHDEIRQWVEKRGGHPATVNSTTKKGQAAGVLRLDFPGYSGTGTLKEISWDEFFRKFDDAGLALLYQDKTSGGEKSLFSKLIGRETAEARCHGESHASRHHRG